MIIHRTPWDFTQGHLFNTSKAMDANEAIQFANLAWKALRVPLFVENGAIKKHYQNDEISEGFNEVEDNAAIMRSSDERVLGIVGNQFTPIQNISLFRFVESLREVAGNEVKYFAAGNIGDGKRVWLMAELPGTIEVVPDDPIKEYIFIDNAHDGTQGLRISYAPIRIKTGCIVFMDTIVAKRISMRHTSRIESSFNELSKTIFSGQEKRKDKFVELLEKLLNKKMSDEDLFRFVALLFPEPKDKDEESSRSMKSIWEARNSVLGLYKRENNSSALSAFNAVIEYINFHVPARNTNRNTAQERRFENIVNNAHGGLLQSSCDILLNNPSVTPERVA